MAGDTMIAIFVLLPLYFIGIQYQRGGLWWIVAPVTVLALALDLVLNFTELAVLTLDWPKWGEWTFSTRLARLRFNDGWRGDLARYVKRILDPIAPSGLHIK